MIPLFAVLREVRNTELKYVDEEKMNQKDRCWILKWKVAVQHTILPEGLQRSLYMHVDNQANMQSQIWVQFCSLDILPLLDILFKAPSFIWCWGLQVLCFHVTHNVCMYVSYSVMEEECRSHKAGWILESLIQIEYICTLPMLCVWKCVNIYIYRYDVCIINLCI